MKFEQTPADLEALRKSILRVSDLLTEIGKKMTDSGLTQVTIHTKDAENKHIPALWKWAMKAKAETDLQIEIFRQAEDDKAANDRKGRSKKRGR